LFLCILVVFVGCAADPNENLIGNPSGEIVFDNVPAAQRQSLENDMRVLSQIQTPTLHAYYPYVLGTDDMTGPTINKWIRDRVRYVVGEEFDLKRRVQQGGGGDAFPTVVGMLGLSDESNIVTVMDNIGAAVYLTGRKSNTVLNLVLSNGPLPVKTARVGVIRIGAGLFRSSSSSGGSGDGDSRLSAVGRDSLGNSLIRAAVFGHEGRHGDGNGNAVAFRHAECTEGTFKGRNACENYLNGPYAAEAALLLHFYYACQNCSNEEREAIRSSAADAYSRVLPTAGWGDARPEVLK